MLNLLPRVAAFLLIFYSCSGSSCTPNQVEFNQPTSHIPSPSITFVTSEPCSGLVKVSLGEQQFTTDLNAYTKREDEDSVYDHVLLLQTIDEVNPSMSYQCLGIGEYEQVGRYVRIGCTAQVVARQGYLKNVHPKVEEEKVNKADAGVIVVYVILIVAVLALLFFIINWLRCMRRRHHYVDNEDMEEVPDNTI